MIRATSLSLVSLLAFLCPLYAAPPSVDAPQDVIATSDYVTLSPKTDAKAITYIGKSGVDPFPSALLADKKVFVLPVRGLAQGRYQFAGVASLNDEHTVFHFAVIVGTPPKQPDPPKNPTDPPAPTATLYFLIVRPDGPASPAFTQAMAWPEWGELTKAKHTYKDKPLADAAALGARIPTGTMLACVVVLRTRADGKTSEQIGIAPFPASGADVLKLPDLFK